MFIYTRICTNITKFKKAQETLGTKLHGEGLSTLFLEVESVNLRQKEITCMYEYYRY